METNEESTCLEAGVFFLEPIRDQGSEVEIKTIFVKIGSAVPN
jgi:hypothetical protein